MNFRVLPTGLQSTALAVAAFLNDDRGFSKLKVEEPVGDEIAYRPTFQTTTPEYYEVWIEVAEAPYLSSLDNVVLHCVQNFLPVKLYVAFPSGVSTAEYKSKIDEARKKGVGAIEENKGSCSVIHEAILLSLSGVRTEERKKFPAKYRSTLSTAEATFINGDPAKGCSLVYDEIEARSRRLAKRIVEKGWIKAATPWPKLDVEKDPWANIMDALIERGDFSRFPRKLKKNMLMRVASITDHRNDTGHKPKNRQDRVRRDRELRTRFESAVDLLLAFIESSASLRL